MPGKRLSLEEREEISRGIACGLSYRAIGRSMGRPASTVTREVARNCPRQAWSYRATRAQTRARLRARRPRLKRLEAKVGLRRYVEEKLRDLWSPEQISRRLRLDFAENPEMQVSHETIYQALYVQTRGSLNKELRKALRSGRARRYKKGKNPGRGKRGKIKDMVLIAERPPSVEDRAVPGHWEGDLIIGGNHSQIITLVERMTRFTILLRLPHGRSAAEVEKVLSRGILKLPQLLRASLTWDQGGEMANHIRFSQKTQVPVFFCDPRSPWQRGTNENTNRLIRQYLPKRMDLSDVHQNRLNAIAKQLNGRPRKTLDWRMPAERMKSVLQ